MPAGGRTMRESSYRVCRRLQGTLRSAAPSGAPALRRQNRTSVAIISSPAATCPAHRRQRADERRRAQLEDLLGEIARRDPLPQEPAHVPAVRPAGCARLLLRRNVHAAERRATDGRHSSRRCKPGSPRGRRTKRDSWWRAPRDGLVGLDREARRPLDVRRVRSRDGPGDNGVTGPPAPGPPAPFAMNRAKQ